MKKRNFSAKIPITADLCLAYRYLYYVLAKPLLPDVEYDMLEREAVSQVGKDHPLNKPGSDVADDYDGRIRALAIYLLLTFGERKHEKEKDGNKLGKNNTETTRGNSLAPKNRGLKRKTGRSL